MANALTVSGQSGLKNAKAIPVNMSVNDQAKWYLVGAIITGPGMGNSTIGMWLTTIDITTEKNTGGNVFFANSTAKEFSVWPQPKQIEGIYTSLNPDAQRIKACVNE